MKSVGLVIGVLAILLIPTVLGATTTKIGVSTNFSDNKIPSWLKVTNGTAKNGKLIVNILNGTLQNNVSQLIKSNGTYTDLSLVGFNTNNLLSITYTVSVEINYNSSKWNYYSIYLDIFNKSNENIISNGTISLGYDSEYGFSVYYVDEGREHLIMNNVRPFVLIKNFTMSVTYSNKMVYMTFTTDNHTLGYSFTMKDRIPLSDLAFQLSGEYKHREAIILRANTVQTNPDYTYNVTYVSISAEYQTQHEEVVVNNIWWIVLIVGVIVISVAVFYALRYMRMR